MQRALSTITILLVVCLIQACGKKEPAQTGTDTLGVKRADTIAAISADSLVIELTGQDSVSVLDLLTKSHGVESRSTALGAFVVAIDSVENSSSAYWLYSVNDTMPQVAADKLLTRTGDRVAWHFRRQKSGEPAAR